MTTGGSEVWAGAIVLLLILALAAILLPPAFRQYGAEWVALYDWGLR